MGVDRWLRPAMLIGIAMGACALTSWTTHAEEGRSRPVQTMRVAAETAGVPQRAVLYEEDPNNPTGQRFDGTATWSAKVVRGERPNQAPETVIEAVILVPERGMNLRLTLRHNTDTSLPASHTLEVMFKLPDNASFGIGNVPGLLMKSAENQRGVPLAGTSVKVTTGFFLIGFSVTEDNVSRNVNLLKERPWLDLPIVYDSGRRAILAVEKGETGIAAFTTAFAAWGE